MCVFVCLETWFFGQLSLPFLAAMSLSNQLWNLPICWQIFVLVLLFCFPFFDKNFCISPSICWTSVAKVCNCTSCTCPKKQTRKVLQSFVPFCIFGLNAVMWLWHPDAPISVSQLNSCQGVCSCNEQGENRKVWSCAKTSKSWDLLRSLLVFCGALNQDPGLDVHPSLLCSMSAHWDWKVLLLQPDCLLCEKLLSCPFPSKGSANFSNSCANNDSHSQKMITRESAAVLAHTLCSQILFGRTSELSNTRRLPTFSKVRFTFYCSFSCDDDGGRIAIVTTINKPFCSSSSRHCLFV